VKKFAERLKELREDRGLSMGELGEKIGSNHSIIGRWERGVHIPSIYWLVVLADFFKVSADDLLGRDN